VKRRLQPIIYVGLGRKADVYRGRNGVVIIKIQAFFEECMKREEDVQKRA
jgi:hypothetical protein